jgi:hypothetical protein
MPAKGEFRGGGPVVALVSRQLTAPARLTTAEAARLLNTTAPGDDLMASRAVLPLVNAAGTFDGYTISPDGKVVVGTVTSPAGSVLAFSAASRRPSVLYRPFAGKGQTAYCNDSPLWISNSGREMLIDCYQQPTANGAKAVVHALLLDGGHATNLPWLAATGGETTAFPGVLAIMAMPGVSSGSVTIVPSH